MTGPDPNAAAVRRAVRGALTAFDPGSLVLVAVSGGVDSMALAAAVVREVPALGLRAHALVIDHGLQPGSEVVAREVVGRLGALGLAAEANRVSVTPRGDGIEAAAREARYAALQRRRIALGAAGILLGHTRDDQAEQVLLGLTRGSGARSLSGMPPTRDHVVRPLLAVTRAQTRGACEAEGIAWWEDPMNADPAFLRVRARRALTDLERDLGPGIGKALARTAEQLRDDADYLDEQARAAYAEVVRGAPDPSLGEVAPPLRVRDLERIARPLRTRIWRLLLVGAGAPAGQVSWRHTSACDELLSRWHGQGPLHVPGNLRVARVDGHIRVTRGSDKVGA
ncbi:MAG: tRNA lysidine(34) synthetase TilS [Phycicoccus sp.]|nr:tRNA lysidine(34) synthetase TilS [Phycicoccus sp.]